MNKEQSIEKIKSTLSELKELALSIRGKKTELKFEEFVSNEGPILVTNGGLEVGLDVFTKDSEGNQTPINDGEFVCEGKKVTVESGKITKMEEIKEEDVMESPEDNANVNVDEEVKVEEKMEEVKKEEEEIGVVETKPLDNEEVEVETPEKEVEISVEDRIKGLEDAVSKILSIMDQMMTKTQETMSQNVELEKKVQELSAQPGDEPVEVKLSKNTQTLSDVELRIERFKNMAKSI